MEWLTFSSRGIPNFIFPAWNSELLIVTTISNNIPVRKTQLNISNIPFSGGEQKPEERSVQILHKVGVVKTN